MLPIPKERYAGLLAVNDDDASLSNREKYRPCPCRREVQGCGRARQILASQRNRDLLVNRIRALGRLLSALVPAPVSHSLVLNSGLGSIIRSFSLQIEGEEHCRRE